MQPGQRKDAGKDRDTWTKDWKVHCSVRTDCVDNWNRKNILTRSNHIPHEPHSFVPEYGVFGGIHLRHPFSSHLSDDVFMHVVVPDSILEHGLFPSYLFISVLF